MPETTENFIRIPIRDCKVTATITISAKRGIKALYCGKIKKVRTYLFDRRPPHNWTMKRAQAWVQAHKEKNIYEIVGEYFIEEQIEQIENNGIPNEAFKI
jgi:hypothetical protein